MSRRPVQWIAIADGEHARFVAPADDNALHTQAQFDSPAAHKRTSDLVSDQPGRSHESSSSIRHGVAPRNDPHDLARLAFARQVAASVNEAAAAGSFAQLVLVAPADILHEIQAGLDASARGCVVGTLMKDLVKVPDHQLQPHLAEWVQPIARKT